MVIVSPIMLQCMSRLLTPLDALAVHQFGSDGRGSEYASDIVNRSFLTPSRHPARGLLPYASGANLPVDNSMHARLDRSISVAWLGRFECGCGECVLSIADTYRAMSDDIKRAAKETNDEGVRRAYLALAELWRKASLRADGFSIPVGENVIPD